MMNHGLPMNPDDQAFSWRLLRNVYMDNISFGGRITDLLGVVEVGQAAKQEGLARQFDNLLELIQGQEIEQEAISEINSLVAQHKEAAIRNLATTILASALVLSHSHLDHSLNILLTVSVFTNWGSWAERVLRDDKASYSLAAALKLDFKEEKIRAVKAFLKRLERKSIPDRSRILLSVVGKFALGSSEHRLSAETLEVFDKARHGVIHQNHLARDDFSETAPQDFRAVFNHLENLCQSVCESCGFDWERLTDPLFG